MTLESLRDVFISPAWKEIHNDDSKICKLINSPVFKDKRGMIDANYLILFAILNCAGNVEYKSEVFYEVL